MPEVFDQNKKNQVVDYAPSELSEEQRAELLGMNITEEFNAISRDLDKFHSVFYQIWEMGYPELTFDVPTAAVAFDKKGRQIKFMFNPLFWKQSDTYTKEFVICHECLHVILNHGMRIKDLKGSFWARIANYALDVVINHMLVDKFNFDRYSIKEQENFCWIDTVFGKDHKLVERNRAFEHYFGLLKQKVTEDIQSGKLRIRNSDGSFSDIGGSPIDMHDFLEGLDNEELKKDIEEHINRNLNDLDKKNFIDKLEETGEGKKTTEESKKNSQAGSIAGGITFKMNIHEKVKKKQKWETVIKKWSLKYFKEDHGIEQWARENRRISTLQTNLMLPSEVDDQNLVQDKIEVWFFQDVSGSCVHLKDRFFRAARSLPEDKFIIRMFCFDTQVHEVDLKKGELKGGGGTSFSILERFVQSEVAKNPTKKHPEAIFVITDGDGDRISPKFPKKWYWFLSYNSRSCIPNDCHIHMLKDFE